MAAGALVLVIVALGFASGSPEESFEPTAPRVVIAGFPSVAIPSTQLYQRQADGDPFVSQQWALTQIGAAKAWTRSKGRGIRIGVVDTGVDLSHEELASKVVASTSCVGSGGSPERCSGNGQDVYGHGTHVSAIAAAVSGNGKGIAGVAPDAELVVARSLASDGRGGAEGTIADVEAGLRWVVDQGADVVNLSLGTEIAGESAGLAMLSDSISYAWSRGAIPVLASGNNSGLGGANEPPDYQNLNAVIVGASDDQGRLASYSGSVARAKWAIIAPGGSGAVSANEDEAAQQAIVSAWWQPN
ncbi:MAG: S8 family serine peptidase, partial [Pseudonocardiaceae bacterium]